MDADVTLIIPHMPTAQREVMLERAVLSVQAQTVKPDNVIVMADTEKQGAAAMRNAALEQVTTTWVAFLDDDDELLPQHLSTLLSYAYNIPGADVLYPGCRVFDGHGREVPRHMEWGRFLQDFDPELLRRKSYIPVTSLVRSSFAKQAKFAAPAGSVYDDWGFYLQLLDLGAKFLHVPVVTWYWHHHGNNSQGLPSKW
jgi:glycosyltransferase involved in cell wall biosynthesis